MVPYLRYCGTYGRPGYRIRIIFPLWVKLRCEVKTPLSIYIQRYSPLLPDLWLRYSRLRVRLGLGVRLGVSGSGSAGSYSDCVRVNSQFLGRK